MALVDFESSIAEFLALGRRLQAVKPVIGQRVLDELTSWYRDTRIEGAELDADGDMLLLQWGSMKPLVLAEPVDLRYIDDGDDLLELDHDVKYLNFTRQVFATSDEDEEEFDDSAVQMSITLGYDATDGTEPDSNLWISSPNGIESGKQEFSEIPYVQSLLSRPAKHVSINVGHCG
jgi:hypothetical protein